MLDISLFSLYPHLCLPPSSMNGPVRAPKTSELSLLFALPYFMVLEGIPNLVFLSHLYNHVNIWNAF